jgi:hypothetical protein
MRMFRRKHLFFIPEFRHHVDILEATIVVAFDGQLDFSRRLNQKIIVFDNTLIQRTTNRRHRYKKIAVLSLYLTKEDFFSHGFLSSVDRSLCLQDVKDLLSGKMCVPVTCSGMLIIISRSVSGLPAIYFNNESYLL